MYLSPHRAATTVLGLALVSLAIGCGRSGPTIVEVNGTVSRGGRPVPNLTIKFIPDEGRPSWGRTDDAGRFTLHYDRDQDGAVVGPHTVYFSFKPRDAGEELAFQQGQFQLSAGAKEVLAKYGSLESSPLKVDVSKPGQVVTLDLE